MEVQTHPAGSSGRLEVAGWTGSGYLACQPLSGVLPWSQLQNSAVQGFFVPQGGEKKERSGYRQPKAGKMKRLATIHSDTQDGYYL